MRPEIDDEGFEILAELGGVKVKKTRTAVEGKVPKDGEELSVNYRGFVKDEDWVLKTATPFDDSYERGQPLKFVLGKGQVIPGWDVGFRTLRVGEAALLECSSDFAYGEEGHPPRIPPLATLIFEVELLDAVEKPRELFEMTFEEKTDEAAKAKAKGLASFQSGDFSEAKDFFDLACHFCDVPSYTRNDKTMPDDVALMYSSCQSNIAMCALKLKDWPLAARSASFALKAIAFDNDSARAKALYRRGVARGHMGLLDEAKDDLQKAARLEPKNRAVRLEFQRLKEAAAEQKKSQKTAFNAVFDKVDLFPDKPRSITNPSSTDNPYAFLTLKWTQTPKRGEDKFEEYDDDPTTRDGRVVIRIFADACPRTARNFLSLCKGDRGISKNSAKPLHYKNCVVHRLVKDFMIQSGDIVCNDGTSGESIYGRFFDDEHFKIPHDKPGVISMANKGPNTNSSQFFITLSDAHHLDGKSVAFGHVVSGLDHLNDIAENVPCDDNEKPLTDIVIADCGPLSKDDAEQAIAIEEEEKNAIVNKQPEEEEEDKEVDLASIQAEIDNHILQADKELNQPGVVTTGLADVIHQ